MSSSFTAADFIADYADEGQEEDEEESNSQGRATRTPMKRWRAPLDRRDFKDMDRVIHHFEITGMIPPPTPSGSSVHSWSSRSPSPFALAAPADEPPPLLGPPAEDIVPDAVPPQLQKFTRPRSESAAPSPPPKRQRTKHPSRKEQIRKKALSFLDIDADDDDEDFEENRDNGDDSEGGEDLDFVDDHEPISAPRIFANAKTLEEEALENEAIAQHYIDKARGLQPARRDATPLLGDDDDKHRPRRAAYPGRHPRPPVIYVLGSPNTELRFIRQILLYPGIEHAVQSAFTRAIGSGAVCVETTDLKLLFKALKQYPTSRAHWSLARLARPIGTLSKGDLVFVQDGAIALGVPRIHRIDTDQAEGLKHGEKRPPRTLGLPPSAIKPPSLPQRLFNHAEFRRQYPDRKLQTAKEPEEQYMFSWHQLQFRSDGLEDLSWKGDSSFFSAAEVTPSETDLKWFIAANDSNHVIKTKGVWPDMRIRLYLGTTCALQEEEKKRTLRGTGKGGADEEVLVRYAAVQKDAATPITLTTIEDDSTFIVPAADLALQALAVVRSLIPGDRVKVVNGQEARGMSARVLGIAPDGMTRSRALDITQDGRDGMDPSVPVEQRRHLHIRYLQRDFHVGDVVNVVRGPTKEFLPCDADRLKVAADKTTSDGRIKYHYVAQDVSFSVPTADIQFLHVDQWHPPASSNVPTTGDRLWAVMLVNDKKFKGYCGIIVGYIQRNPAEKPQYLIQLEARLTQVAVKLEDMRDRDTKRPLRDDDQEEESFPQRQSAPPVPEDPVVEDAVWGTGGALIVPDIGEDNGVWLTRAEFVNKRIDVKIVGVKKSQFPKAIKENTLRTKGIKIRVVPMSHVAIIPADTLKPLRETPSQKCIGEEKGRVIIIGPDVYGSVDRMGQYAETMPGQSDHPEVVQVRFVKSDSDAVSPRGLYALKCLCRALNQELQCGNILTPATPFTDD
ncbi:hypothetical protein K438DRAFT_1972510 [Mycena galopus ATCC 62051]|nr:hypothetical protein K438DRAFT_1972510 [Mycena galopus ATCC 62051]